MDCVVAVDKLMWKLMLLMKLGMHAILELRRKRGSFGEVGGVYFIGCTTIGRGKGQSLISQRRMH